MDQKMSSITLDPPTYSQRIPASTPKTRNQVVLDRGDGRQWTPPPTARELTKADPVASAPGRVGKSRRQRQRGLRRFRRSKNR